MSPPEKLRPFGQEPDHGHGMLGRLAHSVLSEYLDAPPSCPRLHLGQNTLPDPPFALTTHIPYAIPDGAWDNCEHDLIVFLESGAQSLRAQPVPDGAAFSEEHRLMQRMLRMDSIALTWKAQTLRPTESVANWTLTADALAGRLDPSDLTSADSTPAIAVWATDRSGATLLGWAPAGGSVEEVHIGDDLSTDDPIIELLAEMLDAQYTWTTRVFGTGPVLG
jgi:hypothetical protein